MKTGLSVNRFVRFGRELRVSPKSNAIVLLPGYKEEWGIPVVQVLIGIGKDHIAEVLMTEDAWKVFKGGAAIEIETTEEYNKRCK